MEVTKEFKKFITKSRGITGTGKNNILNCICFTDGYAHATNLHESCSINLHTHELDGYMVFHRELSSALPSHNKCLPNIFVNDSCITIANSIVDVEQAIFTKLNDKFPPLLMSPTDGIEVSQEDIDAYNLCKPFVSKDPPRFFLNGVFFGNDIVSTDGRQLHLIPTKTPYEEKIVGVSKLLNKVTVDKALFTDDRLFVFDGNITYSIRLIEGKFPNYKRVFPERTNHTFIIDKSIVPVIKELIAKNKANSPEPSTCVHFENNSISMGDETAKYGSGTFRPFNMFPQYILNYFKYYDVCECSLDDYDHHPLMMFSGNSIHLIMPMAL